MRNIFGQHGDEIDLSLSSEKKTACIMAKP